MMRHPAAQRGLLTAMLVVSANVLLGCSYVFSSLDPNVPDPQDFDRILNRDITAYVTDENDRDVSVSCELLRNGGTQVGVALPKYYVWIEKRSADGTLMEEAAARIAAVEKTHFDVVQYYDRDRILKEPDLIKKVFPAEVATKIFTKVGLNEN